MYFHFSPPVNVMSKQPASFSLRLFEMIQGQQVEEDVGFTTAIPPLFRPRQKCPDIQQVQQDIWVGHFHLDVDIFRCPWTFGCSLAPTGGWLAERFYRYRIHIRSLAGLPGARALNQARGSPRSEPGSW